MAFQIADDILDYTEDESVTGKPGGLDLREHKVTLPLIAALAARVGGGAGADRRSCSRIETPGRRADRRCDRHRGRGRGH